MGFGGLGRPGSNNHLELNHIYDIKWSWDTGGITANQSIDNLVISRNWVQDSPRNGIRLDGHPGGIGQTINHNVAFNNGRGFMLKGDQHEIYNNLAFNNGEDLVIPESKFYGYKNDEKTKDNRIGRDVGGTPKGNHLSIAHNNASNNSSSFIPIINEEDKTNNSSRKDRNNIYIQDELRDPRNLDFRPREGSTLIDAGKTLEIFEKPLDGITDGIVTDNSDIGP